MQGGARKARTTNAPIMRRIAIAAKPAILSLSFLDLVLHRPVRLRTGFLDVFLDMFASSAGGRAGNAFSLILSFCWWPALHLVTVFSRSLDAPSPHNIVKNPNESVGIVRECKKYGREQRWKGERYNPWRCRRYEGSTKADIPFIDSYTRQYL